ncbi:hypothetical protein SUGI_0624080 [Cryptomeria japonica]|nr:hypothetical protein SUGI_0624080 [Cryptomeria japonica]
MCEGWLQSGWKVKWLTAQARQHLQEEHLNLYGYGKRYGSEIFVCHEVYEFPLLENLWKAQIIEEDEIAEHTVGGRATRFIPTSVEGGISDLVGPLVIRVEFEELSLLEAFVVELTFSKPAYKGVKMDRSIGGSALFKHVDTLGEAIATFLPHDTLLECEFARFSGHVVRIINVLHDVWHLLGRDKCRLSFDAWHNETTEISGTAADRGSWKGLTIIVPLLGNSYKFGWTLGVGGMIRDFYPYNFCWHASVMFWDPSISLVVGMLQDNKVVEFGTTGFIGVEQRSDVVFFRWLVWDPGGVVENCLRTSNVWPGGL